MEKTFADIGRKIVIAVPINKREYSFILGEVGELTSKQLNNICDCKEEVKAQEQRFVGYQNLINTLKN